MPLRTYVEKFTNMRFEPAGMTDDPDLRIASLALDYIFRRLAVDYLPPEERTELGILTTGERMQPTLPGVEEAATPERAAGRRVEAPPGRPTLRSVDRPAPAPIVAHADAPLLHQCGIQMQRAGSATPAPAAAPPAAARKAEFTPAPVPPALG